MSGDSLHTHDAHVLALEGVDNFRDMGGYPTADGSRIGWGRLFRSGYLTNMTGFDCQQLEPLAISTIFDLRNRNEQSQFPTQWQGNNPPEIITADMGEEGEDPTTDLFERILAGDIGRDEVVAHMVEDYAAMPFEFVSIYQKLFAKLAEPDHGAVLIHCTAGKDRTGVAIALLLTLLGASREVVFKDYLLSNEGFAPEEKLQHIAKHFARKIKNMDECMDALRPLVRVEVSYLEAAFAAVESEAGSCDQYFSNVLELSEEQIKYLRHSLIAPLTA